MTSFKNKDYVSAVKKRIFLYWILLVLMIIYNVVIGEMGLSDSRTMSALASNISRLIYFGGLIYVISRIVHWQKILKDKRRLTAEFLSELDERREFLHDKSGGLVLDIVFFILLFTTCTTAVLSEEIAFRVSFLILLATIILKATAYMIYDKKY